MLKFLKTITALTLAVASFAAAATLTLNTATRYQSIQGFGAGSVYYTNWLTAHPNRAAIYDTIFTGLGISYLRIGNWNQDTTSTLTVDSTIVAEGKRRLGSRMRLLMSSWSAPGFLKASGQINGSTSGTNLGRRQNTLKKSGTAYVYSLYAHWWKISLKKYQAKGMMPDDVSIQNEPDMNADYEETLFDPTENDSIAGYAQALKAVSDSVNTLTTKPRLIGPEVLGIGWTNVQKYAGVMDRTLVGAINFHLYHAGSYANPDGFKSDLAGIVTSYYPGKPLLMTEYCNMTGSGDSNMVKGAQIMVNALVSGNVSGYINWELYWGGGGQTVNVNNPWTQSSWTTPNGFQILPEYHTMRHFSKFINPGMTRIAATSDDANVRTVGFANAANDSVVIVAVNIDVAAKTFAASLSGYTVKDAWQSTTGGALSARLATTAAQTSFSIPAKSITTVILTKTATSSSSVSSSSVVASSSSKASSSSVAVSSSIPVHTLLETLGTEPLTYKVLDLLGRPVATSSAMPTNLPQGRWIIQAIRAGGTVAASWVVSGR